MLSEVSCDKCGCPRTRFCCDVQEALEKEKNIILPFFYMKDQYAACPFNNCLLKTLEVLNMPVHLVIHHQGEENRAIRMKMKFPWTAFMLEMKKRIGQDGRVLQWARWQLYLEFEMWLRGVNPHGADIGMGHQLSSGVTAWSIQQTWD